MTPDFKPVMDELNYRSYCHQRMEFPHVEPEQWAAIFGPAVVDYEERFLKQFIAKLFEASAEELPN